MSCMIAPIQGGSPSREIFPLSLEDMDRLRDVGLREMLGMLGARALADLQRDNLPMKQYVGAALKPDGTAYYLTTLAPAIKGEPGPVGAWSGAFFAPFGTADIVGTVRGDLSKDATPTVLSVEARLLLDAGGNPHDPQSGRGAEVEVAWEVRGSQATRPNKAALIGRIDIRKPGPHRPDDIYRCIALHAPQRVFGELRAVVAMQCGVAAACLIEAIC